MTCLAELDCGAQRAREELLFLHSLLIEVGETVDPFANLPMTLGFSDVFRCPALGAEDFIRLNKASVGLLEGIAALRVKARERVISLIEQANRHDTLPMCQSNALPSALSEACAVSNSSCASEQNASLGD